MMRTIFSFAALVFCVFSMSSCGTKVSASESSTSEYEMVCEKNNFTMVSQLVGARCENKEAICYMVYQGTNQMSMSCISK